MSDLNLWKVMALFNQVNCSAQKTRFEKFFHYFAQLGWLG